eukprot:gnl/TRDRNA2_/TRDRNA2_171991_c0_seq2.p1 gnl/TRDRNA2_/TRDRNA2_171991_c0~~gnl/TRDRNA2_/TRDRNA2_171991_c0_seq2.p1  ORF type:complete len:298 (+),score=35.87 gnl/TRDRNA2_/TRDRNA2_171991_c0_seq2:24-917(+)
MFRTLFFSKLIFGGRRKASAVGGKVELPVQVIAPDDLVETAAASGDFVVDVRVHGGGGLFGQGAQAGAGRVLLQSIPVQNAFRAVHADPVVPEVHAFLALFRNPSHELQTAPVPADELLANVFSRKTESEFGGRDEDDDDDLQQDQMSAIMHMIRRLASTDSGMSASVKAEWEVLDTELRRRERRRTLLALQRSLETSTFKLEAVVESIGSQGEFTLIFPSLGDDAPTAKVPGDFALMYEPGTRQPFRRGGGLFGAPPAGGAFNFGNVGDQTPTNTAGGLFGAGAARPFTGDPADET